MTEVRTKHEIKTCPRCGHAFECKRTDPVHCDCAWVVIPVSLRAALQGLYRDCLCRTCLTALGAGAGPAGAPIATGDSTNSGGSGQRLKE